MHLTDQQRDDILVSVKEVQGLSPHRCRFAHEGKGGEFCPVAIRATRLGCPHTIDFAIIAMIGKLAKAGLLPQEEAKNLSESLDVKQETLNDLDNDATSEYRDGGDLLVETADGQDQVILAKQVMIRRLVHIAAEHGIAA